MEQVPNQVTTVRQVSPGLPGSLVQWFWSRCPRPGPKTQVSSSRCSGPGVLVHVSGPALPPYMCDRLAYEFSAKDDFGQEASKYSSQCLHFLPGACVSHCIRPLVLDSLHHSPMSKSAFIVGVKRVFQGFYPAAETRPP